MHLPVHRHNARWPSAGRSLLPPVLLLSSLLLLSFLASSSSEPSKLRKIPAPTNPAASRNLLPKTTYHRQRQPTWVAPSGDPLHRRHAWRARRHYSRPPLAPNAAEVVAGPGAPANVPLAELRDAELLDTRWEISKNLGLSSPRRIGQVVRASNQVLFIQVLRDPAGGGAETEGTQKKQPYLFLPGVDGSGTTLRLQLEDLSRNYDLWFMRVLPTDRSKFEALEETVLSFLGHLVPKSDPESPRAVVMGESFGGLLSLGLGLQPGIRNLVERLVLVNPASSFDRTPWRQVGDFISKLPRPAYAPAGVAALMATVPDMWQINKFLEVTGASRFLPATPGIEKPPQGDSTAAGGLLSGAFAASQTAYNLVASLRILDGVIESLPPATLDWRLTQWLGGGCERVNPRLDKSFPLPTLVIAGSSDRMIPSEEEASRLAKTLGGRTCKTRVLAGSGHAALDSRVNVTEEVLQWVQAETAPPRNPITDFTMPSKEEINNATNVWVKQIRDLTAPVFYSTHENGTVVPGLSAVPLPETSVGVATPNQKATLLVGNHQLYGLDLGVMIEEFYNEREVLIRGLAHPLVANGAAMAGIGVGTGAGRGESDPFGGPGNLFETFGAVPVSGRNLDALMREGKPSLLFPGGVREVYHRKGEDYKVFWPERGEFVRAAAKHNATIVPFAAIGIADSMRMLADSDEILEAPLLGETLKSRMPLLPKARDDEIFIAPISVPQLPSRWYFLFGRPFHTANLDYRDREACQEVYEQVKLDVEDGIERLLRMSAEDPFKGFPARLLYNTVNNQTAPNPEMIP